MENAIRLVIALLLVLTAIYLLLPLPRPVTWTRRQTGVDPQPGQKEAPGSPESRVSLSTAEAAASTRSTSGGSAVAIEQRCEDHVTPVSEPNNEGAPIIAVLASAEAPAEQYPASSLADNRENPAPSPHDLHQTTEPPVAAVMVSAATRTSLPLGRPPFRARPSFWWVAILTGRYARVSAHPAVFRPRRLMLAAARSSSGTVTAPVGSLNAPAVTRASTHARRRRWDGWAALALGILLFAGALSRLSWHAQATGPVQATMASLAGAPIAVQDVLGLSAGLAQPREAIMLLDGDIAVADTGNSRIALLDHAGQLLRAIRRGSVPLSQPYSVVAVPGGFLTLEAQTGTIDRFDEHGTFVTRVAQDPSLRIGRGIARAPDGQLYVANPFNNSIVKLAPGARSRGSSRA